MKTKKEKAIQEAYEKAGFVWDEIQSMVNMNDGTMTIKQPSLKYTLKGYEKAISSNMLKAITLNNNGLWVELLSIKNISYNNGWIKIESEADLPKDDTVKYTPCENGKPREGYRMTVEQIKLGWEVGYFTHYRKVESLPYPLY